MAKMENHVQSCELNVPGVREEINMDRNERVSIYHEQIPRSEIILNVNLYIHVMKNSTGSYSA